MEEFVKGEIVVLPFPFSDLSASKKRPALVISVLEGEDIILCQITSRASRKDKYSIELSKKDFKKGGLPVESIIRPNRIFTADKSIVLNKAGLIQDKKLKEVQYKLVEIIK
ncbi:type II toxin-antitoxin system PemK/MazF family toxin [Candidatus Woesearchaeota archaeon]|nr:type II toxin-antitoxin system PemK/MazF family toxin [Candidatus Woesearchaeota archaeon]